MSTVHATPTWDELLAAEPTLADVMARAQSVDPDGDDYWQQYERAKRELSRLVGWHARQPELRSSAAYDVGHDRLLAALEACPT